MDCCRRPQHLKTPRWGCAVASVVSRLASVPEDVGFSKYGRRPHRDRHKRDPNRTTGSYLARRSLLARCAELAAVGSFLLAATTFVAFNTPPATNGSGPALIVVVVLRPPPAPGHHHAWRWRACPKKEGGPEGPPESNQEKSQTHWFVQAHHLKQGRSHRPGEQTVARSGYLSIPDLGSEPVGVWSR